MYPLNTRDSSSVLEAFVLIDSLSYGLGVRVKHILLGIVWSYWLVLKSQMSRLTLFYFFLEAISYLYAAELLNREYPQINVRLFRFIIQHCTHATPEMVAKVSFLLLYSDFNNFQSLLYQTIICFLPLTECTSTNLLYIWYMSTGGTILYQSRREDQ